MFKSDLIFYERRRRIESCALVTILDFGDRVKIKLERGVTVTKYRDNGDDNDGDYNDDVSAPRNGLVPTVHGVF